MDKPTAHDWSIQVYKDLTEHNGNIAKKMKKCHNKSATLHTCSTEESPFTVVKQVEVGTGEIAQQENWYRLTLLKEKNKTYNTVRWGPFISFFYIFKLASWASAAG
jgi:hypothetical protein